MRAAPEYSRTAIKTVRRYVREGITAIVSVKLENAQFESQTKAGSETRI